MTALDRMIAARAALIVGQPFFGCLALHLELVERPDVETMATDGQRLFWAPAFVDECTDAELEGVIAHEAMHCALKHHARIGDRDLKTFNEAADYALNPVLLDAGFTLARGMLVNREFDGLGAEEIYDVLRQQQQRQRKPQQGQQQGGGAGGGQQQPQPGNGPQQAQQAPQQGNGGQPGQQPQPGQPGQPQQGGQQPAAGGQPGPAQGGQPQPGNGQPSGAAVHGAGGVLPAPSPAAAAAEADRWEVIARQAVNIARAHNAGTLPGHAQLVANALQEARADFRELLAAFIDSRTAWDYSFSRPNRRFVHAGFYMPGQTFDGLEHVVFAVDTSGSITADMLNAAAAEIAGAMDAGKIARVTVLMADTAVRHVAEFAKGDDIELTPAGGGGTRFSDTFRWIADNAPHASAVVYLTDLKVNDWGDDPDTPVLWAVHGDSREFAGLAAAAPFGEAVYIGR